MPQPPRSALSGDATRRLDDLHACVLPRKLFTLRAESAIRKFACQCSDHAHMTRTCGVNAGPPLLRPPGSVWSHPRGGYAAMSTRGHLGARLLQGRSHDVRSRL